MSCPGVAEILQAISCGVLIIEPELNVRDFPHAIVPGWNKTDGWPRGVYVRVFSKSAGGQVHQFLQAHGRLYDILPSYAWGEYEPMQEAAETVLGMRKPPQVSSAARSSGPQQELPL